MSLQPGQRLGAYEIGALIGAGGMGEVYRAHDTRLGRDVALKVLPEAFALDPDRVARFKREAQVLASLNHPNIAAIYGFEEGALVLELVEGPTLTDRIAQGPLPLDEALPIARQIADALEAAHEHGVIHRDLKPANIKLRPDGTVKVLDFGLAKAMDPDGSVVGAGLPGPRGVAGSRPDVTASPTITSPAATRIGMILGTAAYMSPEQARGKPVDKRSDIWAFGCVLYEMLTGKRAFGGDEITDTLAEVLKSEPDWSALPREVPASIRALLRRCLEKDRRKRVTSMAVALFEIDEASLAAGASAGPPVHTGSGLHGIGWKRMLLVGATAAVTGGMLAVTAMWVTARPATVRVERFALGETDAATLTLGGIDRDLTITLDGTHVIYVGNKGTQLLVRPLDRHDPVVIASGSGYRSPFVSPEGDWVGFVENATMLRKVALTGGPAITVTSMNGAARGATWASTDQIIFATSDGTTGLLRVSAAGGEVTILSKPDREGGEADHLWPEMLPGGRAVLFTITSATGGLDAAQVGVLDLSTNEYKVLVRGGSHAQYAPTGHLVYATSGTLRAVRFDLDQLATVGTATPVLPRLVTTSQGAADYDIAADGTLVYADAPGAALLAARMLVWVDRQGREEPIALTPRPYVSPRLAPDATRIAIHAADQEGDIWIWDLARRTLTRLTFDGGLDLISQWTPDSRRLVFSSQEKGGADNLFRRPADGGGSPERLTASANRQFPVGVTADGTRVVFNEMSSETGYDVMLLDIDGSRRVQPLVQTRFHERGGGVSPDGRWLAYETNASGRFEIYVRPFPNVDNALWQVSTAGGTRALWSRDGRELFYVAPDGALMAVPVTGQESAWNSGTPVKILDGLYYTGGTTYLTLNYDVSADGRRFLMLKEGGGSASNTPAQILIVKNWFEELKRLLPMN